MEYTIYHNARCKKSRDGLELLKQSGKDFKIREYLKEPLSKSELEVLLTKLGYTPLQLVRTGEKVWKESYRDIDLSRDELIEVMIKHPQLIERPIVENDKKAIVGRPTEQIETIF